MLLIMAFRNIFRKPFRSLLCLITIGIAVFAMTFLFSFIGGFRQDIADNIQDYSSGVLTLQHSNAEKYERQNPLGFQINGSELTLSSLEELDGVDYALPRIPFGVLLSQNGKNTAVKGYGMDFKREDAAWGYGSYLIDGDLPAPGSKDVVMAKTLADSLGLQLGEKFTFMASTGRRTSNAITLRIVGLAQFDMPAWNAKGFFMPIDRAKDFLKMDDNVIQILLRGEAEAADMLETVKASGLSTGNMVINRWDVGNFLFDILGLAELVYMIMGILIVGLGVYGHSHDYDHGHNRDESKKLAL
jgi:putative ABC transport system permease protein